MSETPGSETPETETPHDEASGGGEKRRAGQMGRSAARLAAIQALYLLDQSPQERDGEDLEAVLRDFMHGRIGGEVTEEDPENETETVHALARPDGALFCALVRLAVARRADIDAMIGQALSKDWPLSRLEMVLRAILRAGVAELMNTDGTPPKVIVSEYVDIAHSFYEGPETRMVNAVLDRLARLLRPGEMPGGEAQGSGRPDHG